MRTLAVCSVALSSFVASSSAWAQTWVDGRSTPGLEEIVAVDKTGEPNWLYGFEDLAGDGMTFQQQEQSIDIRTAYASTDADRFWARIYVADANQAGGNVTVFVFIDSDKTTTTGGSAAATEIDPRFDSDPSNGGYEHALEIGGNGSIAVWDWQMPMSTFMRMVPPDTQATAENGQDADPIEINGDLHGYLQGSVDHALVGLTAACNADLFFRSIQQGGTGTGDLDVGTVGPCVPADANDDGVPDVVVPPSGCTSDAQCPGGGVCVNGECIVPQPCADDGDCDPDERCSADVICVPVGGGACDSNFDCGDLVCRDDVCQPCTPGSDECGAGRVCASDGRCVGGVTLLPGQEAQGGAFTCATGARTRPLAAFAALALGAAALLYRRRRRPRS
jgi:hypothetical protein